MPPSDKSTADGSRLADDHLYRFVLAGMTAEDIAESLVSFDADHDARTVRQRLREFDFDLVGIRGDGVLCGYARREDLVSGQCGDFVRPLIEDMVLPSGTPLRQVLPRVGRHGYQLVTVFGAVCGIITLADLQKPPVRMWLFGLITMIEEGFGRVIRNRMSEEEWSSRLSSGRLEAARHLQHERRRRNESLDLLDCLQFADKAQVLLKEPAVREHLEIPSATAGRRVIKDLEQLRNRLAHAQDIVTSSLQTIVRLALRLDLVLEVYSGEE